MAVKFDLAGPIVHNDGLQETKELITFRGEPFTGYALDGSGVGAIVQDGKRGLGSTAQNIFGLEKENLELFFQEKSMFLTQIVQYRSRDLLVGSWIDLENGLPIEMVKNHLPDAFFHLTESVNFKDKRQEIRFWNPAAKSEEETFYKTFETENNANDLVIKVVGQDISWVDSLGLIKFNDPISDLTECSFRLASKVEISYNLLMQLADVGYLHDVEHIVVCLDPNQEGLSNRKKIEFVNEGLEQLNNSAKKCPNLITVESAIALPTETKFFNFSVIAHSDSETVGILIECEEIRNRETKKKFGFTIHEAAELKDTKSVLEPERRAALLFWGSEEMDSLVLKELGDNRAKKFGEQLPGFAARNAAKIYQSPSGIPRSLRLPRPLQP